MNTYAESLTIALDLTTGFSAMFDDLDSIRSDCMTRLTRAAKDRRSPMHTPVVVTGDVDARVMVLRGFARENWTLRFHTDARAPKAQVVARDPRVSVLFYDKSQKIQLRVKGTGEVLPNGPVVEQAWAAGSNFARRCYLGDGPGTPSDTPTSGLPPAFEGVEPSDEDLVMARDNFAVLLVRIVRIDWLYLAHTGHVRAVFERGDTASSGDMGQGQWVSP